MQKVIFPFGVLVLGLGLFGQTPEKGAKALFLDTQNGHVALPKVPAPLRAASSSFKPSDSVQVPAITGVMYYLELLQPDGQLVRVTSSRVFHSGEKVRLHVTSNVDGAL